MNESNKTTQTFKWVVYEYEHALTNIEKKREREDSTKRAKIAVEKHCPLNF